MGEEKKGIPLIVAISSGVEKFKANDGTMVEKSYLYGLGNDGNVFCWDKFDGGWKENKIKPKQDAGWA